MSIKNNIGRFKKSEEGVVGIVVAVLLIGLLVAFISLIQVVYVPQWMEEKEAEHMHQVEAQFAQLKLGIDNQVLLGQECVGVPIATSITLGSEKMPFFMSLKAYGDLRIIKNATQINVIGNKDYHRDLGIIQYSSANAYFINQGYIYESGALITNQTEGCSISVKPSFYCNGSHRVINFTIVNISVVGGKLSYGGYDTIPIRTEFFYDNVTTIENAAYLSITSTYHQAWNDSLTSSLKKAGLGYTPKTEGNTFSISFDAPSPLVTLNIKYVEIKAQIGPGWVES